MKTTVKTAISIDADTFDKVERLRRKIHISRSRFFTQAAQHILDQSESLELLSKINAAFDLDEKERTRRKAEKKYSRKRMGEQW